MREPIIKMSSLFLLDLARAKKSNHAFVAEVVADTGFSALVVDFSGHGASPFAIGETTPAQHLLEATKAYDWLKTNYPKRTIHAIGTSYGGFMAAYLTRFRSVQKLILRTPAIYEPKDFYTEHQYIDKLLIRKYRKDTSELKSIHSFCKHHLPRRLLS